MDLERDITRLLEEKQRLDDQYREWDAGNGAGSNSWGDEGNTWEDTAAPSDREADWNQEAGSGNWQASDTGTGWDDDEWGREPDEGTGWGAEGNYAAGDSWEKTTALSYGQGASWEQGVASDSWPESGTGWDGDEWGQVPDEGTGRGDESTYVAGSIQDYDDLMAELLQEGGRKEELGRGSAESTGDRRGTPASGGRAPGAGAGTGGRPGNGTAAARSQAFVRGARASRTGKGELEEGAGTPGALGCGASKCPHSGRAGSSGEEAREQSAKVWANLANTIVMGVARIKAGQSGIDPATIPGPPLSVSPEAWGAVQRGAKIWEQSLPIRLSPTPTICSVSPWTAGKGRRRRIEEAIRLILDCSENRTGV